MGNQVEEEAQMETNLGSGRPYAGLLGVEAESEGPFNTDLSLFPPWQVEVQCLLLLEVLGGSHKHAVDGAVKKLTKLWKEVTGGSPGWQACCGHAELLPLDSQLSPSRCRTRGWWSSTCQQFST